MTRKYTWSWRRKEDGKEVTVRMDNGESFSFFTVRKVAEAAADFVHNHYR